jgi:hypothetical protein
MESHNVAPRANRNCENSKVLRYSVFVRVFVIYPRWKYYVLEAVENLTRSAVRAGNLGGNNPVDYVV